MAIGFALLATSIRSERSVLADLQSLEEVVEAEMLFGTYDVIARFEGADDQLALLPDLLKGLRGVEDVVWYRAEEVLR